MNKIIECVPNFSEGRNKQTIDAIAEAISSVAEVKLLNVDPGYATNRTVYTFIGEPNAVCEAAFRAVKCASELIDMRTQTGAHPRMGATDVLPLIPVADITLAECVEFAHKLSTRIWEELQIPVYNYEAAASRPERKKLESVRAGEYEGLEAKIKDINWLPDKGNFNYAEQVARSGATILGAREFLIAVNFNLKSTSVQIAKEIAADIRESGRKVNGVQIKGSLKGCKAIGWFIDEYNIAQVSMNITDINVTPLHIAYEEVCRVVKKYGVEVSGTEIIGLVPLRVLIEAGEYFYSAQQSNGFIKDDITISTTMPNKNHLVELAVKTLQLSDISEFVVNERVLELCY